MADAQSLDPLILDLVEWVAREPRAYPELIDAWRTSCPRLTVWEDAVERGFVRREGQPPWSMRRRPDGPFWRPMGGFDGAGWPFWPFEPPRG